MQPSRAVTENGRRRRGATTLTRDALVVATIRIADTEGAAAVTMRRIGAELGVDPTAVYRHFRDKDELLQAAADKLLAGILDGLEMTGDWPADLRALARIARRRYLEHPDLLLLVASAPGPLQSEAAATEAALAFFRSGGFDREEAVRALEVVQDYIVAMSVMDAGRRGEDVDAWRRPFAGLPRTEYPYLADSASLLYGDDDERFEYGIALLADALDRRRSHARG
jgi:AcrR family transcriptional regulator